MENIWLLHFSLFLFSHSDRLKIKGTNKIFTPFLMLHVLHLSLIAAICLLCLYKLMGRKGPEQWGNKELWLFGTCSQLWKLCGCGQMKYFHVRMRRNSAVLMHYTFDLLPCNDVADSLENASQQYHLASVCHYFVIPSPCLPIHSLPHKTWLKWMILNLIKKQCLTPSVSFAFYMLCDGLL